MTKINATIFIDRGNGTVSSAEFSNAPPSRVRAFLHRLEDAPNDGPANTWDWCLETGPGETWYSGTHRFGGRLVTRQEAYARIRRSLLNQRGRNNGHPSLARLATLRIAPREEG